MRARIPASSASDHQAPLRRIISRASCCARRRASTFSTCPTRAVAPRSMISSVGTSASRFSSLSSAVPQLSTGKIRITSSPSSRRAVTRDCRTFRPSQRRCPALRCHRGSGSLPRPRPRSRSSRACMMRWCAFSRLKPCVISLATWVSPSRVARRREFADDVRSGLALRGQLMKSAGIEPE